MIDQAEQDRVKQLLAESLPALCQASLSGVSELSVEALIGITLNQSDVFLVSIKETCLKQGEGNIKVSVQSALKTKSPRGRPRKYKATELESTLEEIEQSQSEEEQDDTSRDPSFYGGKSPRKKRRRSTGTRNRKVIEASASDNLPKLNSEQLAEGAEMPDLADVAFSDDNDGGGGDDFSDIDDSREMDEIQKQIAKQENRLDTLNIKQETNTSDVSFEQRMGGSEQESSFLDRPYTITKNPDTEGEQQAQDPDDAVPGTSKEISDGGGHFEELQSATLDLLVENESSSGGKSSSDVIYQCSECEFKTKHKSSIYRHKVIHEEGFRCKQCNKMFDTEVELQEHTAAAHKPKQHNCFICSKIFNSRNGLKVHLMKHNNDGRYFCQFCNKPFSTIQHLRGHENKHRNVKPYTCNTCQRSYTYHASLKAHYKYCAPKKPIDLKCKVCEKVCLTLNGLKEHKRAKHSNKIMRCEKCEAAFEWRVSYRRHVASCKVGQNE